MTGKMITVRVVIGLSIGLSVGIDSGGGSIAAAHGKNTTGGSPAAHAHNPIGRRPTAHADHATTGTVEPGTDTAQDTQASHGKKGGQKGVRASYTGSTTCSVRGKLTFYPPLVRGGTANSTVTVTGLLSRCSTKSQGHVKLNNGHLAALVGTISSNDCTALPSILAPPLSGGSVVWTPPSNVMESSDVSMPTGTTNVAASGRKSVLQISYVGGVIGSGSFSSSMNRPGFPRDSVVCEGTASHAAL